jgi:hypothetical protein
MRLGTLTILLIFGFRILLLQRSFTQHTFPFSNSQNVVPISFVSGRRWVGVGAGTIYGWSQNIRQGVVLIKIRE